jgi:DNA-directed RNA polymerase omega subunit
MKAITRHNVDTDKCVENIGSRFDLVLVAALRVRELKRGHRTLLNTSTTNGLTITALAEIEAGLVGRDYLKKI